MFRNLSLTESSEKVNYPITDSKLPFSEYITICRNMVETRRGDLQTASQETAKRIIDANSPFAFIPNNPILSGKQYKYGVLLIHGLFDCPFTMMDIGRNLQASGILSHGILLPGHGTQPADLLHVSYHDWIQAIRYGIESLRQEVENVYLVGYSAGAALAVYHAVLDKQIAGIGLIAPAIRVKIPVTLVLMWHKLLRIFSKNKAWLYNEDEIDYAKYRSIPFNPVNQIIRLTEIVEELVTEHHLTVPTFMALSQDDQTISARKAIDFFSQLPNSENRLLLYTANEYQHLDPRILLRPLDSTYPQIKNYSHICLPFKANNTHYGLEGDFSGATRLTKENIYYYGAYNRIEERCYSILHQLRLSNPRRELSFNPDFDYLAKEIVRFIQA